MTKAERLGLSATLVFLLATSLPPASEAQALYGSWTGIDIYSIDYFSNGQVVDVSDGSVPTSLGISLDPDTMFAQVATGSAEISSTIFDVTVGPQSASGTVYEPGFYSGIGFANFFVTYQSILPDGTIQYGNGMRRCRYLYSGC